MGGREGRRAGGGREGKEGRREGGREGKEGSKVANQRSKKTVVKVARNLNFQDSHRSRILDVFSNCTTLT